MENWAYCGVGTDKGADIFIVAPTVVNSDDFNMPLDDKNRYRFMRALNMQKGIYEDGLRCTPRITPSSPSRPMC